MKFTSLIIVAGAAYIAYNLIKKGALRTLPTGNDNARTYNVGGGVPIVNFAQNPNSNITAVNYYKDNPNAQPWDFLSLGYGFKK